MTDPIYLISSKNNVFIWSANDWLRLRRDHRIIGELVGTLPKSIRQDVFPGLPLLLFPEEVTLLVEKKIACVVQCTNLEKPPTESLYKKFQEYTDTLLIEQEERLIEFRKQQVTSKMGIIVDGKKRKILGLHTNKKNMKKPLDRKTQEALDSIKIDTESLLEEELAKLPKLNKNEALVQTHTAHPWFIKDDVKIVDWKYPLIPVDQQLTIRYKVYKDLWERKYYITSGEKFGGDFLAYPGDPIMFHAYYIIQCKCKNEEMPIAALITQCRVSCNVRKTLVFATYCEEEDKVKYQSFQWTQSNTLENGLKND
ncbi:tRNA-splicing endonuclease subunit Sen34 [Linepithema humile]|uniref:tRNA-splicing endonuclease subunit Sen34 n=1 Tax=Linepithema humile TaxID=83485 RepID=UPI0006237B49|nr:PREDICTED: tRNA-splicing endonuclease subunit Sen34 [Linepithema humile]